MKTSMWRIREKLAIAAVVFALALTPQLARAQCEVPGVTMTTANGVATALQTALRLNYYCVQPTGAPGILCVAWQLSTQIATATANGALTFMESEIYRRLRKFWDDYLEALQDMTSQLNSSLVDSTRSLNGLFDTGNMTLNQRSLQMNELQAKKQYIPTDEGCRFDTAGSKLGTTTRMSRVYRRGIGKQFGNVGTNEAGTPAAKGPASVAAVRWENYHGLFCDKNLNGGRNACPGSAADGTGGNSQELAQANVTIAKTIFSRETIPMNDTTALPSPTSRINNYGGAWKAATDEIIFNLTGYQAPQPIPGDAVQAPTMKDRRMEQRAYSTQMDVMVSMVGNVVAERTPGDPSPEIQQLRQANGVTNANPNPSEKEIRQSVLDQMWNPNYYVNLQDASSATARKEVYLKAYNLMLLYKLIDKTELVANAFAVETANMIETYMGDAASDQETSVPIRP